MKGILSFEEIHSADLPRVGGKALALAEMLRSGVPVPGGLCVATETYRNYVRETGLAERIALELNRKPFSEMRWEEIWDASLRIRNMFAKTALPGQMQNDLGEALNRRFGDQPVAVRSSAPGEDASGASFAGLHDSYMNISSPEPVMFHIRLVWASLWSDAALLYRKELELDIFESAMAVVVQEMVPGDASGVMFTVAPGRSDSTAVEAVYGLNQGLVDGTVEPDRWFMNRATGEIQSHTPPPERFRLVAVEKDIIQEAVPPELADRPPLDDPVLQDVFNLGQTAERYFGSPQDVEWTTKGTELFLLQSRPVTTEGRASYESDDKRPWYRTLTRSFDNLEQLRDEIENSLLPQMETEADVLKRENLEAMTDDALAAAVESRNAIVERWTGVYWDSFIPFAHGMRLFGQVYNDSVRPDDPYEFMTLLGNTGMQSTRRDELIREASRTIGKIVTNPEELNSTQVLPQQARDILTSLAADLSELTSMPLSEKETVRIVSTFLNHSGKQPASDPGALESVFLQRISESERPRMERLLDLARASARLRDDDNIYLGRVERELTRAVAEGRKRLEATGRITGTDEPGALQTSEMLKDPSVVFAPGKSESATITTASVRPRQMTGQPAGPGVGTGFARVILSRDDIFSFNEGEVLVCDSIDPNFSFIAPLAAAIVERRGGMLIHGAIIAREYGIPCVTGIPDATQWIETGDRVTVDGFLGQVTRSNPPQREKEE